MNTSILSISGTTIKQDAFGRFCLNDLHKASGGEAKHKPSNWLRMEQTSDLIAFLKSEEQTRGDAHIRASEQNQPLVTIKGGLHQGTYAVKELIYSYAMWISAKFHISVIRAYDAIVMQKQDGLKELPPAYLTHDMKRHIQELVNARKYETGESHNTIYHNLKTHFQTSTYAEIPIIKYEAVCEWFGAKPKCEMPKLIQCDSRYLGELEKKAAALLEVEQKNTAFVEITDKQTVIEKQRLRELEFISTCLVDPERKLLTVMAKMGKESLELHFKLMDALRHATPVEKKSK